MLAEADADPEAVAVDDPEAVSAGVVGVLPGAAAFAQIAETFGDSVLHQDGSLNRERLGQIVFADAGLRAKLNEIVHPLVREWMAAAERAAVQAAPPSQMQSRAAGSSRAAETIRRRKSGQAGREEGPGSVPLTASPRRGGRGARRRVSIHRSGRARR